MNTYILIGMGVGIAVVLFLIKVVLRKEKKKVYDLYQQGSSLLENANLKVKIKAIINAGHKIEAIKYINEKYDTGLAEAKNIVDKIEKSVSLPDDVFGKSEDRSDEFNSANDEDLKGKVKMLLHKGKKIEAIKLVTETKKSGLKEAKDFVESVETNL